MGGGAGDGRKYLSILDAFSAVHQRVSLIGVVLEYTIPKLSKGTDYFCSVRLVDESHYTRGLSVQFFARSVKLLPRIEACGDIIVLSDVEMKVHSKEIYALCNKRFSSFALYEGKYGNSFTPYQVSSKFKLRELDKAFVADLRKWLDVFQLDTASRQSVHLRGIKVGEYADLVCKIIHVYEVNKDERMLFVWDGTDAPVLEIQTKSGDEEGTAALLQLEAAHLPRDILCTFPTVGTVLRVYTSEGNQNLSPSLCSGRWVIFINLTFQVQAGLWSGECKPFTKIRFLPDEDHLVLKLKRLLLFVSLASLCYSSDRCLKEVCYGPSVGRILKFKPQLAGYPYLFGECDGCLERIILLYAYAILCTVCCILIYASEHRISDLVGAFMMTRDFEDRVSSKFDRMPFTSFPWPSPVTETERSDVPFVTLLDIITYPEVTAKFKCVSRVIEAFPWKAENFRSPSGTYRIRLTLEDPTARIQAYVYAEDGETFFQGYPLVDEMRRKRNKLLGIAESDDGNETEDSPRNPPWVELCIKSYYVDKSNLWASRRYRIFGTRLTG